MKIKRALLIKSILPLILVGFLSMPAMAASKAGFGFTFGTMFQSHQKANFKQATASFFRLVIEADSQTSFFLHNEQANFSMSEGDANVPASKNTQAIGMTMFFTPAVSMDVMVGGTTLNCGAAVTAGGSTVAPASSTDAIAEIAVKWTRKTGRTVLNVGLGYRSHKLGAATKITPKTPPGAAATPTDVTDMSSMNLAIGIGTTF